MNKSKMVLAATGGAIGVLVLAMAYLVWSSFAAKTAAMEGDDESEGLEAVVGNAERLSHKDVYPCAASVKAIASNETLLVAWKAEAFKLAARGDRPLKNLTPAQFKSDVVAEAKRLVALPGSVQGKIAKPEFAFGPFKEYIQEGKMPADARLPELQRQWDDLTLIVELLAENGICELVDIQLAEIKKPEPEDQVAGKKAKKPVKSGKKGVKAQESADNQPLVQAYRVVFTTRPAGLVKCINALETNERFFVVEDFALTREKDAIAEALGGGEEKAAAAQQTSGRRRRRAAAQAVEPKEEETKPKNGLVTDPQIDAPVKVELTVSTYDFKTLQEAPKGEEDKK